MNTALPCPPEASTAGGSPFPEHPNEEERLAALLRYDILDTDFEAAYDDLTKLASAICGTPISLISLIDDERQWFKSTVGLDARETPKDQAFCAHAILHEEVFVIEDALADERFSANPLVVSDPHIRFYAGAPLISEAGHVLGTLCVIDRVPRKFDSEQRDVLRVLAKQVMNQLELRLTFRRLQLCTEQLHESNVTKDKFFYMIAHDLRAPFNGIIGYSDLLMDGLDAAELSEQREMAEGINSHSKATLNLLNNLLEWAMCQSGRIEHRPAVVPIDEVLDEVTSLIGVLAQNKSVNLSRCDPSGVQVFADRYMLFSVLQNLMHNAIKFTPIAGSVQISTEVRSGELLVTISDTGVGMTDEILHALFRLDETISRPGTEKECGTGLGLVLCKQFVEKNGGQIGVSSEAGEGSAFWFSVPLQEPEGGEKSR